MNENIEKRLHRVKITFKTENIQCPYSEKCSNVSNCMLCNIYFQKCSLFKKKSNS